MQEFKEYLKELKNNPPRFVISVVAPPNGGKGTQCAILSTILGIPAISVGALIRAEQDSGSDLGREFYYYTDNRLVAPAALTLQLLAKRLIENDCKNGFILEGYPRTWENADAIKDFVNFDLAIEIEVPEEVLLKRMRARGRVDDKEDKQQKGMQIYKTETLAVAKTLVGADKYFKVTVTDDSFFAGDKNLQQDLQTKIGSHSQITAQAMGIDFDKLDDLNEKNKMKFENIRHTSLKILAALKEAKNDLF